MSNIKCPQKNLNGLLASACVAFLGLIASAQHIPAQSTATTAAFDSPDAFIPWDGGYAAIQKKFSAENAPTTVTATTAASPAEKPAAAPPAPANAPSTLAALAASQVINWSFNLDNLLRRMGELRLENLSVNNGGDLHYNGNLWTRAHATRLNASDALTGAAFHEYTYGASLGADKTLVQKRTHTALAGLMGDFSKTTRSFTNASTGSTQNAGAGLYLTLLAADGWFADLAGRYDSIKTKFTTPATPADISGSYTTSMETLSLEAGRVFKRADGWWVEPSLHAAIAWAGSAACAPAPGTRVALASARDLQYRATLRFGRQPASAHWLPYAKLAIAKVDTTGGAIDVTGASPLAPALDGVRAELGLGTIYRIDEFNQLYLDYTCATALNYDSPWNANLGYRLLW